MKMTALFSFVTDDGIETHDIVSLCESLEQNTSLTQLEIHSLCNKHLVKMHCFTLFGTDNKIEMNGIEALKQMLERNTTIEKLTFESLDERIPKWIFFVAHINCG